MEPMMTDYSNGTTVVTQTSGDGSWVGLVIAILVMVAYWKVFVKAGEAGWKSLIPIYNSYILLKITGKPWWYLLLLLIPIVNIVIIIVIMLELGKRFGKSAVWSIFLLVLLPIVGPLLLGFGDATYKASRAKA